MQKEIKICKNCKRNFTIETEDFKFYEKMKVPAPTFCRNCRLQRRMTWRNERALYKRNCDLCKQRIISMHDDGVPFPVYCPKCWYGDGWDALSYGREYDFSRPFFVQLKELFDKVPHTALFHRNVTGSEYSNWCAESKNVYLSVSVTNHSENVFYSKSIDGSFNIFDSYNMKKSEDCYESIDCENNYNSHHCVLSRNCIDSFFLIDCVNCNDCFMSYNLRNKKYYIRNVKYSKEDYLKKISEFNLGNRSSLKTFQEEFEDLKERAIYRFANIINCVNSTGNNLSNTENCRFCFDIYDSEDSKYIYRAYRLKDCMDMDYGESELMYEYTSGARADYNVKFTFNAIDGVHHADYTDSCMSSTNLFGCASVRGKENVILNKVYKKSDFEKLREKIIKHMEEMPYIDKKGRVYKYGEFFPNELSPFGYNETIAWDFFLLSKEKALEKGYRWKDQKEKGYKVTLKASSVPNNIKDVKEGILKEVLECEHRMECNHQCLSVFRITPDEFGFYKKHNIPIPNRCPNCRYYERFAKVTPLKLWYRQCACKNENHGHDDLCPNEFETAYAPDRPEKVYCESCYNKEVY